MMLAAPYCLHRLSLKAAAWQPDQCTMSVSYLQVMTLNRTAHRGSAATPSRDSLNPVLLPVLPPWMVCMSNKALGESALGRFLPFVTVRDFALW